MLVVVDGNDSVADDAVDAHRIIARLVLVGAGVDCRRVEDHYVGLEAVFEDCGGFHPPYAAASLKRLGTIEFALGRVYLYQLSYPLDLGQYS